MSKPHLRGLAWLLGLANAHMASSVHGRELYALKERLCRRYGVRDGDDVQRIIDECWACNGTGGVGGETCRRCYGSGAYDTRWILLERWRIADRVFHRPAGFAKPRAVDFIDGRIRHDDVPWRVSAEAAFWLALLFDRRLFWRMLSRSRRCEWPRTPMLALQAITYETRTRLLRLITPGRCVHCGRWFYLGRRRYWGCRSCRTYSPMEVDCDLPF